MLRKKARKKLTGTIHDYKFVKVKWFDTLATNEWMSIGKATRLQPAVCYSYGFKLKQTREKITIFADYSEDEDGLEVGNLNTIPTSWVQEIKVVKV